MDSDRLNRWLTLGANLGVIAGIVFLAIELRQNTEATISSAELDVTNLQTEFHMRLAENADLARVYSVGQRDPAALTETERSQFRYLVAGLFLFIEGVYKQYRRGFIPVDGWTPYEDLLSYMLDGELTYDWWTARSTVFWPEFEHLVDGIADGK